MEAKDAEVATGTETTISCVITGISATASVSWFKPSETKVEAGANFEISSGTEDKGTQTATLKVKTDEVKSDIAYTCRVKSGTSTHHDTTVNLNTYGRFLE